MADCARAGALAPPVPDEARRTWPRHGRERRSAPIYEIDPDRCAGVLPGRSVRPQVKTSPRANS